MNKSQIGIFILLFVTLLLCIGAFFYVNDATTKVLAVIIGAQTVNNLIQEVKRL